MPIATRERLWRIALALAPPLALVLLRGVDTNWDLRNYHLYNPHAWLTGRMAIDVAPAQLQTWHNPLLDVPLYLLVQSGWDLRWASVWLTLPWSAAIYLLLGLQASLSPEAPGRAAQGVLALLAMSGAAAWSMLGNSMNDGFVAAAILGCLAVSLREEARAPSWLIAGALAGAITGLKLTAGVYCVGLAAMALVPGPSRAAPPLLSRLAWLAAGGLLGFLCSYGWWGWLLQREFGNPFFPYLNDVFASSLAPTRAFVDERFRAHGVLEALSVPVRLLWNDTSRSELYLRDPRLLCGALGFPLLAWWARQKLSGARPLLLRLAIFFWVSLLGWALLYGIYRYAALLEMMGALALVLGLARLPTRTTPVLLLVLVLASKATHRPDWGHARHVPVRYGLGVAPITADAMVVLATGEPLAYLALALPQDVPMVAVENNLLSPAACSGLDLRARQAIDGHEGSLWLLSVQGSAALDLRTVQRVGLAASGASRPHASALGSVEFTPLVARGRAPVCR